MPSNNEELEYCVEQIRQLHRGVLQIPKDFKLTSKRRVKSKAAKDEDGQSGN